MVDTIQRSKAVFCGNTVSITEGRETERGDYALISDAVNAGKTASLFSCVLHDTMSILYARRPLPSLHGSG
ncbi:hypothetical protein [Acetobacter tropicalis]|uniref:hypothetical protein n=1 Tax=Acetobacter tropicalis TaxID=104102 RepID=UPI000A7C4799|nr:hypothetical protein [Acetobacter tropicalis]